MSHTHGSTHRTRVAIAFGITVIILLAEVIGAALTPTAHVVVAESCFYDGHAGAMLDDLQRCVAEHFDVSIEHSTFQLETAGRGAHEHSAHH